VSWPAGVARLLADLGWSGVANVQFVRAPGGRPRLIDLNGRLYGSLALAYATGVNVPDLWAAHRPRRARRRGS
jgi:predicted ATP-grasp superfamily ATP-dependent carboligase